MTLLVWSMLTNLNVLVLLFCHRVIMEGFFSNLYIRNDQMSIEFQYSIHHNLYNRVKCFITNCTNHYQSYTYYNVMYAQKFRKILKRIIIIKYIMEKIPRGRQKLCEKRFENLISNNVRVIQYVVDSVFK